MIIRKLFKAESSHVVRNCYTDRCKYSIHGHSTQIEVFLRSYQLDNAGMVLDFGILKNEVKDFIDSFDHSYLLWNKESNEYKDLIRKYSNRYIELPISPSAENLALIMLFTIDKIIKNTVLKNGEYPIDVVSVRYHETDTGYAEADQDDLGILEVHNIFLEDIKFSDAIISEWKNKTWFEDVLSIKQFIYEKPEQQIIK